MLLESFLALTSEQRNKLIVLSINNTNFIELDCKNFSSICSVLSECINLEQLSLENDNLGSLDEDRSYFLGIVLSELSCLTKLSLRYNHLNKTTTLPLIGGCLHLEILRLRGNHYIEDDCLQLKNMIITNNKETGLKIFGFLINPIYRLNLIIILDLSFDNFWAGSSILDLQIFGKTLLVCFNLKHIKLEHNNLGYLPQDILYAVCDAISQPPNLQTLSLNGNKLKISTIRDFLVSKCPNLSTLHLSPEPGDTFYIDQTEHQNLQHLHQFIADRSAMRHNRSTNHQQPEQNRKIDTEELLPYGFCNSARRHTI